jgi:hypothetical protein
LSPVHFAIDYEGGAELLVIFVETFDLSSHSLEHHGQLLVLMERLQSLHHFGSCNLNLWHVALREAPAVSSPT